MTKDISNIIVSSRVRLARNLEGGITFKTNARNAFDGLAETIKKRNKNFISTRVADLGDDMAKALFEQHLISKELLANKVNSCIVVKNDNTVCVMLGEEDHIRIQSIQTGLALKTAFEEARKIADDIACEHEIAYRTDFGYLTSCPTNLGCAMRASVMIFLPALTITGQIKEVIDTITKQLENRRMNGRITVRGVYGEGTESAGNMYQISNQACLGLSEQEIVQQVEALAIQLAKVELKLQQEIHKQDPDYITDKIMRSWGILTNAFMLSSAEAVEHLAYLKLGTCLGIIEFKNNRILDDWFFIVQPATLTVQDDRASSVTERDKMRAKNVAKMLRDSRIK